MSKFFKIPFEKQPAERRVTVAMLCIVTMLFFMASGCGTQDVVSEYNDEEEQLTPSKDEGQLTLPEDDDATNENAFYYYEGKKIYLQKIKNQILLKFASDADKAQLRSLIGSDDSLEPTSDTSLEGALRFAVLKTKDGSMIPLSTIGFFKTKEAVVSASYLFQYNGGKLQGLMDEFVVKLTESTSYKQLQELAEQNNCTIGDEDQFLVNQYKLYVPKTSDLDAMQMSNLFYETGLFEFSEPNCIIFNAFDF